MSLKSTSAVLFIAHGSPRKEANDFIIELCKQIEPLAATRVQPAFLNDKVISIHDGCNLLLNEGFKFIEIFPFFLAPGEHIQTDIPRLIESLRTNHPEVVFTQLNTFGLWPELPAMIASYFKK